MNSSMKVYSVLVLDVQIRLVCFPFAGQNITDNYYKYRLFYVELSAKSLCYSYRFLPNYKRPIVNFGANILRLTMLISYREI